MSELTGELATLRQEQERAAGQEDQHNIESYREKLAQASARISKLEGQVEIQRQRLGQYYQRFSRRRWPQPRRSLWRWARR